MTPLDCSQVDELLLDFLYDELSVEDAQAVEQHLAGCPRCTAEVAGFRRVRQAARELPVEEPSPLVTQRLLEAAAGRNVVPLPLPGARAEGAGRASGVAPTEVPADKVVPPGVVSAAPVGAALAGPTTGDNSASVAAQVIDAAKARARRWYAHPALSVAALFAVGLAGTTWMLATRPDAVTRPVPMATPAMSPAPDYPPGALAKGAHAELGSKVAASGPGATEDGVAGAPARKVLAEDKSRAANDVALSQERVEEDARRDRRRSTEVGGELAGQLGSGARGEGLAPAREAAGAVAADEALRDDQGGAGGAGLGHGRTSPSSSPAAPPAPQRPPGGHGQWLNPDTKVTLERSIEQQKRLEKVATVSPPADKEPPRASEPAPRPAGAAAASDDEGPSQRSRFAPPPPPAAAAPTEEAVAEPERPRTPPRSSAPRPMAADAPAVAPAVTEAANRSSQALEAAGKDAGRRAKADAEEKAPASSLARLEAAYRQGDCGEGLARYQELHRSPPWRAVGGKQRLWVASCLVRAGDLAQARREVAGLRLDQPEWSASIDELLATIDSSEAAQRRAVQVAPAKAASPAKAKAAAKPRQASPAD